MESPPYPRLQSRYFDPNTYPTVNWEVYFTLPPAEAEYQLAHVGQSRSALILALMYAGLFISLAAVSLRFVSRKISKTSLQADDWMMVVALVFILGLAISGSLNVKYGAGRHAICLSNPFAYGKTAVAIQALYPPAIASIKISTLLLYLRIFPGREFRLWLWSVGLFLAIYTGVQIIAVIFQCRPFQKAWDPLVKGECIQVNLLYVIMGGMNLLTDIMIFIAPLPTLWRLQMAFRLKVQLMSIFCIAGFVCVVSIIRIPKLKNISFVDAPWSDSIAVIWSCIEISVASACSCAITFRPLFNWIFGLRNDSSVASGRSDKISRLSAKNNYSTSNRKARQVSIEEDQIKMVGVQVNVRARDEESLAATE